MYYSLIYMYIHIYLHCKLASNGEGIWEDHYILYPSTIFFTPSYGHHLPIYKIMTVYHLSVNRNRRRKRELLEAAHASCGLKRSHENLTE